MIYHVETTLTLSVLRDIEADSEQEAVDKAKALEKELRETIRDKGTTKYEDLFVYDDKWIMIHEGYDM